VVLSKSFRNILTKTTCKIWWGIKAHFISQACVNFLEVHIFNSKLKSWQCNLIKNLIANIFNALCMCSCLFLSLSTYLPMYLSIYLPTHKLVYLSIYLSIYLFIYLSLSLSLSNLRIHLYDTFESTSLNTPLCSQQNKYSPKVWFHRICVIIVFQQ
jgi:hypothetical protein